MALCHQTARAGAFSGPATAVRAPRVQRARLVISASFKNKENINLEAVSSYKHHANDCGSTEVQIARLSARVEQITKHLQANRKDYSGTRGLQLVLNQRRKLMQYLYRTDRDAYDRLSAELRIRSVIAGDNKRLAAAAAAAAQ